MLVSPADEELARLAQGGDAVAFGLLITRHRAGMRAAALRMLGPGPDVDDAVQDASLTALRHIGGVRDPAAIGAWLRAVVRNACRARLRERQGSGLQLEDAVVPDRTPGAMLPEEILERHALRDWIWQAMSELSPPLQAALLMRYFSGATSYEQIAALCKVPVGTVRSRLNQARAVMSRTLLSTADEAQGDAARLIAARHYEGVQMMEAAGRDDFGMVLADRWSPQLRLHGWSGAVVGRQDVREIMDRDAQAGERQVVRRTLASADVTIWENELLNGGPNLAPEMTWVLYLQDGWVRQARVYCQVLPDFHASEPIR
jgi:RNA polymerase sigma factor (sigma-70 family)